MVLMLKAKFTTEPPPDAYIESWVRQKKAAHKAIGEAWIARFLGHHFARNAHTRYHYQERTEKYRRFKARAARRGKAISGDTDLVFSGLAKAMILASVKSRGFPTRTTITADAPDYFRIRFRNRKMPNMADEVMNRFVAYEEQEINRTMEKEMSKAYEGVRRRKTETLG